MAKENPRIAELAKIIQSANDNEIQMSDTALKKYQAEYKKLTGDNFVGTWIDPAGGVHSDDEDDPAKMYEAAQIISDGKVSGRVFSFSDFVDESEQFDDEEEDDANEYGYGTRNFDDGSTDVIEPPAAQTTDMTGDEDEMEEAEKWETEPIDYKIGETVYFKPNMYEELVGFFHNQKGMSGVDPDKFKLDTKFRVREFFGSNVELADDSNPNDVTKWLSLNAHRFSAEAKIEEAVTVGFGMQAFFFAKNGDSGNYFFKLEGTKPRAFVLTIGKFSKFTQPSEPKSDYGVMSITELTVGQLDQSVVDKGAFEPNQNEIHVTDSEFSKLLEQVGLCVGDYVQKNPKVGKMYEEMQSILRAPDYDNRIALSLDKWPGSSDAWVMQVIEKGKLNLITKK